MTLTLILLAAIGVILLAERSTQHLPFAAAAFSLSATAISFIVGDFDRAILLAGLLAAAIAGASATKHNYSALKLVITDLPLMFAGTAPFFISQYPRAVLAVMTGTAALILAAIATLIHGAGPSISLDVRVSLFSAALICVAAAFRMSGGGICFQRIMAQRHCFYSTFMASLIDPHSWSQVGGLTVSDIVSDPLPLMAAVPARTFDYPDIIVIQHEPIGWRTARARLWILFFSAPSPCSRQVCRLIRSLPPAPACSIIAGRPTLPPLPNGSAGFIARL